MLREHSHAHFDKTHTPTGSLCLGIQLKASALEGAHSHGTPRSTLESKVSLHVVAFWPFFDADSKTFSWLLPVYAPTQARSYYRSVLSS